MVFLDLTNAFGCLPHQLLWWVLDLQSSEYSVFSRYLGMTHKGSFLDYGTKMLPLPFVMISEVIIQITRKVVGGEQTTKRAVVRSHEGI